MKAYFPKLDSIRFYAFLLVFISHIYIFCYHVSEKTSWWFIEKGPKIFAHGELGVHIFFTLSGFLIMFLAIRELRTKNSFSILGFFRRRILRIWPLYFLGLSAGILIAAGATNDPDCINRFWYFLGNTCMAQGVPTNDLLALVGPLWSVSVEEQFYLTFPFIFALGAVLFRKWGRKTGIVFVLLATIAITYALYRRYRYSENWDYISYATLSVLPSLFLGMITAVVLSIGKWVTALEQFVPKNKKILIALVIVCIPLAMYVKFSGALGVSLYILVLFISTLSMILLSLYTNLPAEENPTRVQKTTRYLGRISYGLYVYHMFAIVGVKHLFDLVGWNNGTLIALYGEVVVILGLTILMAHLSYQYIEKFFLRYK